MLEQVKVVSTPEQKKQITVGDNVPLIVWSLDLQRGSNGDGETLAAELVLSPGEAPPSEGSTVTGDLSKNEYGWKLKLPRRGGGGSGGRPRTSPEERRSIERQVSCKIAAESLFAIERDASREDVEDWGKKLRWLTDEAHAAIRGE